MKIPTKLTLLIIGCLFLLGNISAQTINRKVITLGLSSGIAFAEDFESVEVDFNIGYFPARDLALGLELTTNNITVGTDDYPYPSFGLGLFMRFYPATNFYTHISYESGSVGDNYDYNKFTINLGYSHFLSRSIAIEPKVFYAFHNESGKSYDHHLPGIGLGIQTYLNRH